MFNKLAIQTVVASAVLGLAMAFVVGPASAGTSTCDPKKQNCDLCHNIGGPNALGADCDAGNCGSILATDDQVLKALYLQAVGLCAFLGCDANKIYGGIVVPFGDAAFNAHYNHGDGFTLVTFDRIHDTQPHVAANVGCFAVRHDPDPGN